MTGTKDVGHGIARRVAGALCVLALVVFGVLAGQHYLAPGGSDAVDRFGNGGPPAGFPVEAGGVSAPCGSCDARHRHIARQREATP
jgi:hypothetical protein